MWADLIGVSRRAVHSVVIDQGHHDHHLCLAPHQPAHSLLRGVPRSIEPQLGVRDDCVTAGFCGQR